jgi:PAS domain S-box-containing protein
MSDEYGQESVPAEADIALAQIPLHSTNLLTLLDAEGIVHYESPAIERLYGYDQNELVGEQVAEYFHPKDRERVVGAFETIVTTDEPHVEAVEYRHRMADGSYTWVESVGSTNPTPGGYYVINSRDVSERKERERELDRARAEAAAERDGKEAIRRLLLETSTDTEITASVCRLLVDGYGCAAAWVVRTDGEESMRVVASKGRDGGFREHGDDVDPATRQALDGPDPVAADADGEGTLAARLRACSFRTVRSVPLVHEGICYGALTALREDAASSFERELVAELADAIAFKQQVNRQAEALAAERVAELEFCLPAGNVLAAVSAALPAETRLVAEELQQDDAEAVTYLVRSDDVPVDALDAAVAGVDGVREYSPVSSADATPVVRVRVDPPTVGGVLAGHGGAVRSMRASDGEVVATAQFPARTDLGRVAGAVREHWPEATVRSRTDRRVDAGLPIPFDGLTDKQDTALRAATLAGFFERPQGASAADVAETLGVTPSTFLHHLRRAEQKIFTGAFGQGDED